MWDKAKAYIQFLYYTTFGYFFNKAKHDIYMDVLSKFEKKEH